MKSRSRVNLLVIAVAINCGGGCISTLLPANIGLDLVPEDVPAGKTFEPVPVLAEGVADVYWLEIERRHGPGTVGGFISAPEDHDGGLVLLLDGAGTFLSGGELGSALAHYRAYGADFRVAGFMTWSLVLPECATPYGEDDLADALEVVDWLAQGGTDLLGVERVYLVGYSTGATVANLVNVQRDVTAVVSMGGLTRADQFRTHYGLYDFLVRLFPHNVGFCQLAASLDAYGAPDATAQEQINVVDRVAEMRNPTLFIHGTADIIYFIENTEILETRYRELQAAGVEGLPDVHFAYIPGGNHFEYRDDPAIRALVIDYLLQFEPAADR